MQFRFEDLARVLEAVDAEARKLVQDHSDGNYGLDIRLEAEEAGFRFDDYGEFLTEAQRHPDVKSLYFRAGTETGSALGILFTLDQWSCSLLIFGTDDTLVKGTRLKLERLIERYGRKRRNGAGEPIIVPHVPPGRLVLTIHEAMLKTPPEANQAPRETPETSTQQRENRTWRTLAEVIGVLAAAVGLVTGVLWLLDRLK